MTDRPIFLEVEEVAGMLRITARTLEVWREEGYGPPFHRSGKTGAAKITYRLSDVEAWLERLKINVKGA